MPVDPQIQALLDEMRELGAKPFEELTVPEARAAAWSFAALQGEPEEVASVEHTFVPGPTAELPVRIYTPAGADGPYPGLVYFHGSGWVVLNIAVCDTTMRALANSTGCKVVAVNYQKAPEHPFPIPFDDCWAATNWVVEHAEELGIDAARIGVIGDTAGGNLAAAVALRARDEGAPEARLPGADLPGVEHGWDTAPRTRTPRATCSSASPCAGSGTTTCRTSRSPTTGASRRCWRPTTPACRRPSSLPPSSTRCATTARLPAKLHDAGVPSTYVEYDGMIHGFYWMQGVADGARCTRTSRRRSARRCSRRR